jgi:ADP-ribosylglycohydrolase
VDAALRMPGGGAHALGPGQFTDDSELALCLAAGLATRPCAGGPRGPAPFPLDAVAHAYGRWLESPPFDVGATCAASMAAATPAGAAPAVGVGRRMQARAAERSGESKANGALMRATPVGIWAHRLPAEGVAEAAIADASLSHPNAAAKARARAARPARRTSLLMRTPASRLQRRRLLANADPPANPTLAGGQRRVLRRARAPHPRPPRRRRRAGRRRRLAGGARRRGGARLV